jgi:spore coat protein A, manganese oxidase
MAEDSDPGDQTVAKADVAIGTTHAEYRLRGNGQLGYDDSSESGLWGDVITVNGKAWPVMRVKRRVYRSGCSMPRSLGPAGSSWTPAIR